MRIGWKKLFSYLNKKPANYSSIGIEYDVNGLNLCALKEVDGLQTWVLQESFPLADWQANLKAFVEDNAMSNSPTNIIFSTKKYQLLQTDKPAVPDEEVSQALQWSVKDLLMTQDEVAVDYFDLPAQTTGANKVNVVALPKNELYEVCQGILEAGLFIKQVSVEELATCDLLPDSGEGYVTVFQSPGAEVCLNIVKDGNLYFSRRIRGYENIATFSEMELQMGVSETLSVELQRSMDFFESQLRQAPVKCIYLNLDTPHQAALAKLIQDAMLVDTMPFEPHVNKSKDLSFEGASYTAIGGAVALVHDDPMIVEIEEDAT